MIMFQTIYPLVLCHLSNSDGYFECFEERGLPYSLVSIFDAESELALRHIRVDCVWLRRFPVVPYDYDSALFAARFSRDRLVLGFGCVSLSKDGAAAVMDMEEVGNFIRAFNLICYSRFIISLRSWTLPRTGTTSR